MSVEHTQAGAPGLHPRYTFEDGDIILASSDGVEFRVHRLLLKTASPVFEGILSLPTTEDEQASRVQLDESSFVLGFILDIIYPRDDPPTVNSYDEAHAIARAADKYDMSRVLSVLRSTILAKDELRNQPLRLFSLARRCKWSAEIASSSTKSLETPLFENLELCMELPKQDLFDLAKLHKDRKDAFKALGTTHVSNFFFDDYLVPLDDEFHVCETAYRWHCKCDATIDDEEKVFSAFKMYLAFVSDYIERVPMGTALFTFSESADFDKELAVAALKEIHCENCGKAFFSEERTWEHFHDLDAEIPKTITA